VAVPQDHPPAIGSNNIRQYVSYKITRCWVRLPEFSSGNRNSLPLSHRAVLSIFIGVIAALSLIIRELRNAPMGYESEDGFHFGEQFFLFM
jgi:hypothetical protein